jgi:hypothetical protein
MNKRLVSENARLILEPQRLLFSRSLSLSRNIVGDRISRKSEMIVSSEYPSCDQPMMDREARIVETMSLNLNSNVAAAVPCHVCSDIYACICSSNVY